MLQKPKLYGLDPRGSLKKLSIIQDGSWTGGPTTFNFLGIHFSADLIDIVNNNYNLQLSKIKA